MVVCINLSAVFLLLLLASATAAFSSSTLSSSSSPDSDIQLSQLRGYVLQGLNLTRVPDVSKVCSVSSSFLMFTVLVMR